MTIQTRTQAPWRVLDARGLLLATFALWGAASVTAQHPRPSGATPLAANPRVAERERSFFPDANLRGQASQLRLVRMGWGRLVDVHAIDAAGDVDPEPLFEDFVIRQDVTSDGVDYRLFQSRIGGAERLIVLREADDPDFLPRVRAAKGLVPVAVKGDDDGTPGPFPVVARNPPLVCVFDDLLDDSRAATANLFDNVRVRAGYPPELPVPARVFYDPNHGGLDPSGEFHPTRVVIDFTISEVEQMDPSPFPLNPIGLPESDVTSDRPNVSVRFPTELDFASGQFSRLSNLIGTPLSTTENGPVDRGLPTLPVVRGMRSGNVSDVNRGFLQDMKPPRLLGEFSAAITGAVRAPGDTSGRVFLVNFDFQSLCAVAAMSGDVLTYAGGFVEVLQPGLGPNQMGQVRGARVAAVGDDPVNPNVLVGPSRFITLYRPSLPVDEDCWVSFTPRGGIPATLVDPSSLVQVRFNEPLARESLEVYESLRLIEGVAGSGVDPRTLVPGELLQGGDAASVAYAPALPLDHTSGVGEAYHIELTSEVSDLAGNAPGALPGPIEFTLDPAAPTGRSGGVVLRFEDSDELEPLGSPDLRGQFFFDLDGGSIGPRPVIRNDFPVDRGNPVPSLMIPLPVGTGTPLVPLGAKQQAAWRYADAGFQLLDETKHNLDIEHLYWTPAGGVVFSDLVEQFEIRLSHGARLPDEARTPVLLPRVPQSGLLGAPSPFAENVLNDPESPQQVVHPAGNYVVDPSDLSVSSSGSLIMPYPLNTGPGPSQTFTWRDTAVLARGGENGLGVPMGIEVGPPLFLEPEVGSYAGEGEVPSIGLPLLMEFRMFPSNTAIGFNFFDVSLAINSSARPNFRAFSAGGVGTGGRTVTVNPDIATVPRGGFNPNSLPPGQPTMSADNLFYIGQMGTVTKVSRVHTIWFDAGSASPGYSAFLLDGEAPPGTQVAVAFRGADGFSGAGNAPFDAADLDPYGDLLQGEVVFHDGASAWSEHISTVDGARYVQVRLSFISNIESGASPKLASVALVYEP